MVKGPARKSSGPLFFVNPKRDENGSQVKYNKLHQMLSVIG